MSLLSKSLSFTKFRKINAVNHVLQQKCWIGSENVNNGTESNNLAESASVSSPTSNPVGSMISDNMRFNYPEFLPCPTVKWRNVIREKLERQDMLNRRKNIDIPEFYVGTIMAATTADKHAVGKSNRFVGICVERGGVGLRSWFALRNVIEHQGVEYRYELYSPLMQKIEVLRLEKRLDSHLLYLRDAPNEYSTFPFDMEAEYRQPGSEVPINLTKVPLNPRPWLARYERMGLQGAVLPELPEKMLRQAVERAEPWKRYDLMDQYRATIPEEEQRQIYGEIKSTLEELERRRKTTKRQRTFIKPDLKSI